MKECRVCEEYGYICQSTVGGRSVVAAETDYDFASKVLISKGDIVNQSNETIAECPLRKAHASFRVPSSAKELRVMINAVKAKPGNKAVVEDVYGEVVFGGSRNHK